jgi:hypothetical protein
VEAHCIRFSRDSNDLLAIGTSAGTIEVGKCLPICPAEWGVQITLTMLTIGFFL